MKKWSYIPVVSFGELAKKTMNGRFTPFPSYLDKKGLQIHMNSVSQVGFGFYDLQLSYFCGSNRCHMRFLRHVKKYLKKTMTMYIKAMHGPLEQSRTANGKVQH